MQERDLEQFNEAGDSTNKLRAGWLGHVTSLLHVHIKASDSADEAGKVRAPGAGTIAGKMTGEPLAVRRTELRQQWRSRPEGASGMRLPVPGDSKEGFGGG